MITLGELVMILDLHRQGLSISEIARRLDIDCKTVRTHLAKGLELAAVQEAARAAERQRAEAVARQAAQARVEEERPQAEQAAFALAEEKRRPAREVAQVKAEAERRQEAAKPAA